MSQAAVTDSPPAADSADAPPLDPEQQFAIRRRKALETHVMYLGLAVVAISLAMTMSVQEGTKVTLPFFNSPLPELCHSRRYFGVDCPGCGMTRCFISLGHGDLISAAKYNVAGLVLFGLTVLQVPYRSFQIWRLVRWRPEWRLRGLSTAIVTVLMTLMFVQWGWKLLQMGS